MTGRLGRLIVTAMRKRAKKDFGGFGPWGGAFTTAPIGIYVNRAQSRLIFFGFSADKTPQMAAVMHTATPGRALDDFLRGGGISPTKNFPTGPLGGAVRCGQAKNSLMVCAWLDSSVLVMLFEPDTTATTLAGVALDFRKVAEH
ncbi:MAG: hypothetical protein LBV34_20435 [Nocardiopsaceae bacterium]|jgi:hypothetical protein|nr:hypothetical protein [Nocardiopsaceae bacterium]